MTYKVWLTVQYGVPQTEQTGAQEEEENKTTENKRPKTLQLNNVSRLMDHPGISNKVLLHGRLKRTFIKNRFNVRRQIIPI